MVVLTTLLEHYNQLRADLPATLPSTNIRQIAYDAAGEMLFVEFNTGAVYVYFDVEEARVASLLSARTEFVSIGRVFQTWLNEHKPLDVCLTAVWEECNVQLIP